MDRVLNSKLRLVSTLIAALALLLSGSSQKSAMALDGPTIKLVIADGATLSDIVTVTAKVSDSNNVDIDKVEFAIDDQLKFTDQSVPYEFDWDTLADKEGTHTISATAYNAKGKTASTKITITVDNELSKGATALSATATEALKAGETEKAMKFARRALVVEPTNIPASRVLANLYRSKGEFNKGIEVLAKLDLPDSEIDARAELVALHIMKGDSSINAEDFIAESTLAAEIYHKIALAKIALAKAGSGDIETLAINRGDAYFADNDWNSALREYESAGDPATGPMLAVNRTILTLIRSGRLKEANLALSQVKRSNRGDKVTETVQGLYFIANSEFKKAEDALAGPAIAGNTAAQIANAYVLINRGQMKKARVIGDKLKESSPQLAETQLLISYLEPDALDAKAAFTRAVALEPNSAQPYVVRGGQVMSTKDSGRFKLADPIFDFALKLDPKSSFAMIGKSLSFLIQQKPNEAEPMILKLLDLEPNAPDVHFIAAALYQQEDKSAKITQHLNIANKIDPDRWADAFVPKPQDLATKVLRFRFAPMISPASLFAESK
ncbi:MAG: Ig-like domain-containing protein [Chthonomonadales bacterium]